MNKDINKIVKKMLKKRGKLFFKEDIFDIIDPDKQEKNKQLCNKILYRLKAQGIILGIRAGVYIVPMEEDIELNSVDLLEKYYMKYIKKLISKTVGSSYYISGQKSLEIHMKNYSIPEKLFIVNRAMNKKVLIGEREIIFKTISAKDIFGKRKIFNAYSEFSKYTQTREIEGVSLRFSGIELSLLESALVGDIQEGIDVGLLTKAIKKYRGNFDYNIFEEVAQYKYVMAFNRLKELSKNIDTELYEVFLDCIKKNGACFIGEGKRGI